MTSRTRFTLSFLSWLLLSYSTFDLHVIGLMQDERSLLTGESPPQTIAPNQKHVYRIDLQADQYLALEVEQHGIDVSISLIGPDNKKIYQIDSSAGPQYSEFASLVASISGTYLIEIHALPPFPEPGQYTLKVSPVKQAMEIDRHHAAADFAMAEGDRFRTELRDSQGAMKLYEDAIREARESRYAYREADAGINLGYSLSQMGESLGALSFLNDALAASRIAAAKNLEMDAINNTGIVYRTLGEWQVALTNYSTALKISREASDRMREAIILINLGNTYRMTGDLKEALNSFRLAYQVALANKDTFRQITALSSLGVILTDQGNQDPVYYQKALETHDQAIELCLKTNEQARRGQVLINKASTYRALEQFQEALNLLEQAKLIFTGLKDRRRDFASVFQEIGRVEEKVGRLDQALQNYNEAFKLAQEIKDTPLQVRALASLARGELNRGDLANSHQKTELAIKTIEQMRTRIGSPELRANYLSLHRNLYDFYVDLLLQMDRLKPGAQHKYAALRASESSRGRVLMDNLLEARENLKRKGEVSGSRCQNFKELVEREQTLQRRLEIDSVEKNVDDLIREYRLVGSQIKACHPNYYGLIYQKPLDIPTLQKRALDPKTILLEFALGEERSHLFLLAESNLETFELPKRAEIEGAASDFYEHLRARSVQGESDAKRQQIIKKADETLPRSAAKLSHMLFGKVADKISGKRLLIVGDGELHRIPFTALPTPQTSSAALDRASYQSNLLIFKHEIVQLPSATILEFLLDQPQRINDERKTIAVLADPVFSIHDSRLGSAPPGGSLPSSTRNRQARKVESFGVEKFDRLPGTRKEATTIVNLVPLNQRMIALGFDANQELASSAQLANYRIVHFATHSIFNRHPELSGLALSMFDRAGKERDGYLRLGEILGLSLNADLVVLSACETGVGKPMKGEGLIGITRGFLSAGADRVIASLWRVDDDATSQLMSIFYRELLHNKKPAAAALRSAQLKMLELRPGLSPFYWASFVIQGNPR